MLLSLLEAVDRHDPKAQLYFLGDYVNRGPDSKPVVDLLLTLPNAQFVRGNHDEIFDLIINGQCFEPHPELHAPIIAFQTFLQFGLENTLLSYGIDQTAIEQVAHRPGAKAIQTLLEPIPESHRAFFRALPGYIIEPDLFVAHAKWDMDRANDDAAVVARLSNAHERHLLVWGRYLESEIRRNKPWTRPAFFGHTPVATYATARTRDTHAPIIGPMIHLLDTGAALSMQGRLTAYCVEERNYLQINRAGELMYG